MAHLHDSAEHQRASLARELHDELGGLLVGAVMDVAWAEQHLNAAPRDLQQKLSRAHQSLSAAIDLKRRLIEQLRPTLLDNVGLFAAVRWHIDGLCKSRRLACSIEVPTEERVLLPNVPIILFRIIEESLAVATLACTATVALRMTFDGNEVTIRIVSEEAPLAPPHAIPPHRLAAIEQRTHSLEGEFSYDRTAGGTHITARIPLTAVTAAS